MKFQSVWHWQAPLDEPSNSASHQGRVRWGREARVIILDMKRTRTLTLHV
jgi:hypothetical protein